MAKFFSLTDMVPFYDYTDIYNERDNDEVELDNSWVEQLGNIGFLGEELVKKYLENNHNAIVNKQKDSAGYDFKVYFENSVKAIEVKTSARNEIVFFMSYNEVKKACELKDMYKLYFVWLKQDEYDLLIIDNPCENLKLYSIMDKFHMKTETGDYVLFSSAKFILNDVSNYNIVYKFMPSE